MNTKYPIRMPNNNCLMFATIKLDRYNVALLLRQSLNEPYRFVGQDGYIIKFKTKTSAHNAAIDIADNGLEEAGFELLEAYELGKNYRKKARCSYKS